MNNLIVLVRAVLDVVVAAVSLPQDWNDETAVEAWLDGMNAPLAKVIALLTPDDELPTGNATKAIARYKAMGALVGEFAGKKPEDLDWKVVVDWVVSLLCTMFPAYATIIQMVGTILKQLLDLLDAEFDRLDTATAARCKAFLAA